MIYLVFCISVTIIFAFTLLSLVKVDSALLFLIAMSVISRNVVVFNLNLIDLRLVQILWLIFFMSIALQKIVYGRKIIKKFPITKFLVLLIFSYLISCVISKYPLISIRETFQLIYFVMIFVIISSMLKTRELVRKSIVMLIISSLFFVGFGIYQAIAGQPPFPSIQIDHTGITLNSKAFKEQSTLVGGHTLKRISSFFMGPVGTAAYLVTILGLILGIGISKNIDINEKIVLYVLLLLGIFLLLMTYSRAGFFIFFLSVAIFGFLKEKYFFSVMIVIIGLCVIFYNPLLQSRALESFSIEEGSTQSHLTLWLQAIILFGQKPFFGYGAGTFPFESSNIWLTQSFITKIEESDAHNMFLQIAAETGIFGLIAILGIIATLFKTMWMAMQIKIKDYYGDIIIGLFIALSANILINLTMNAFMIESFWIFTSIGYAAARLALSEQQFQQITNFYVK